MKTKLKVILISLFLVFVTGCRDEVFSDQPINTPEDGTTNLDLEGYTKFENNIYINDSLDENITELPDSYEMVELDAEIIAEGIADHYNVTYSTEELVIDTHKQTYTSFGENQGEAIINVSDDNRVYMDLSFGDGGNLSSLLIGEDFIDGKNLEFMSIEEIEEESTDLLQAIPGLSQFNFSTYTITEEQMEILINERLKIAEELNKPMPLIESKDLYYVFATPLVDTYEILAFEILGREADWTLFNPGSDITLIFSEDGLESLLINSLYVAGERIPEATKEAEYGSDAIIEKAINQFRERLDTKPILVEEIDFTYLTYIPDQNIQEKIYRPFWRVTVNSSDGTFLDKLYFDPLTGSQYQ